MPSEVDHVTFNIEPQPGFKVKNTVVFGGNIPPGSFEESSVEKKSKSWKDWLGKKGKKPVSEKGENVTLNKATVPLISSSAAISKGLGDLVEKTAVALNSGLNKVADDFFQKAMEETKREMRNPKLDNAEALDKLGELCLKSGDVPKAVACFEHSLHLQKVLFGKNESSSKIIQSLFNLGNAWLVSKNYQRAIVVYEKAMKGSQAVPKFEHDQYWSSQLAEIYQNMGKCWEQLNEHKVALGCYGKAESIRREAIKKETPKTPKASPAESPITPSKPTRQKKQFRNLETNLSAVLE